VRYVDDQVFEDGSDSSVFVRKNWTLFGIEVTRKELEKRDPAFFVILFYLEDGLS
jgi:hypothetical protein